MNLSGATQLCRILGDVTRVRLLAVLAHEQLTVAELTETLRIPQSRVSTHLKKLRQAGLVRDRRAGGSSYYAASERQMPDSARAVWTAVKEDIADPLLEADARRARELVSRRNQGGTWADAVAGNMARHYSPGRTWEAAARSLVGLLELGDVLDAASGDGAIAELFHPRARSVTCLDASKRVIAKGRERMAGVEGFVFMQGDMHDMPFADASFDAVLLMSALPYARDPQLVFREVARVLRPGGRLVGATLSRHEHRTAVSRYNHLNQGFAPDDLRAMLEAAGLRVALCEITSTERRMPHFEVVTIHARHPPEQEFA